MAGGSTGSRLTSELVSMVFFKICHIVIYLLSQFIRNMLGAKRAACEKGEGRGKGRGEGRGEGKRQRGGEKGEGRGKGISKNHMMFLIL